MSGTARCSAAPTPMHDTTYVVLTKTDIRPEALVGLDLPIF